MIYKAENVRQILEQRKKEAADDPEGIFKSGFQH